MIVTPRLEIKIISINKYPPLLSPFSTTTLQQAEQCFERGTQERGGR